MGRARLCVFRAFDIYIYIENDIVTFCNSRTFTVIKID